MGQGLRFSTRDLLFATALAAVSCVAWADTPNWSSLPRSWWLVYAAWFFLAFGLPILAVGVLLKHPRTFGVFGLVLMYIALLLY
jgi:hypothetical protein